MLADILSQINGRKRTTQVALEPCLLIECRAKHKDRKSRSEIWSDQS